MNDLTELANFRGSSRWVQRGPYSFTAARNLGTGTMFRCGTAKCPAHFWLRGGVPGPVIADHDHDPEVWIPERNEMYTRVKERCLAEVTGLLTIYEEEALRYNHAAAHLPYRSILPSMRKWRRSTQPAVPATLSAYGRAVEQHAQYGALHLATVAAGGATAVVLGMPGFAECLQASHTIIADGTFRTVPAGLQAYQILTLHAVAQGEHYHPVIALMENRRAVLYGAVLRRVWELAGHPRPQAVVTDYEPALQGAMEEVVGVAAQGCFFHFMQALVKRARQEHLAVTRNSAGARLVRLYGALALLPPDRVEAAFADLPQAAQTLGLPFNAAFHRYFGTFWMNRIRPEHFSVHGRPHRTSNSAESFHATLKKALGASPNIWRFTRIRNYPHSSIVKVLSK